jgi:hypothetical protein
MSLQNEKQTLIENISTTENFGLLEHTFSMLTMGWTLDDDHQDDYKMLLKLVIGRIKTLCIINGIEHPLSEMNIDEEEDKIKSLFMLSMIKSMFEKTPEPEPEPEFKFNFNLN